MPLTTAIQVSWTTSSATAWLGTYVWGSRRRGPLIALDEVDEDALIAGAERHDDGLIVPCHTWIRRVDHVSPEKRPLAFGARADQDRARGLEAFRRRG